MTQLENRWRALCTVSGIIANEFFSGRLPCLNLNGTPESNWCDPPQNIQQLCRLSHVVGHIVQLPEQFEDYSWHDNAIHGLRIVEGDDGCSGDLILDIDFIVEWLPPQGDNNAFEFKVAPADLTFHEATDLVVSVDYASSTAALQPMTIHEIHREVISYLNGHSSFAWKIEVNWPRNSFISFRSSGFTQVLKAEPIVSGAQYLSPSQRAR